MLSEQQASKELMDRNWSFAYFEALDKIDAGLKKLGVSPGQLLQLIDATNELKDADFRAASFDLLELKNKTGKSSKEAEVYIKQLDSQITSKGKQSSDWTAKIEKAKGEFRDWEHKRNDEKASFESEQARNKNILKEDVEKLNRELSQNNEIRQNIGETIKLNAELKKIKLDLPAFKSIVIEIVQEAGISQHTAKDVMESVQKLGSLKKAIAERETESRAKKQDILGLSKQEAEKREILSGLDDQTAARHQTMAEYDKKIESKIRELEWCNETIEKNKWQYQFFELFISMLSTPPSPPGILAAVGLKLQELSKRGWMYSTEQTAAQCRAAFITLVMGEYIHSIHCGNCGASFIVNKAYNFHNQFRTSYYCPVCTYSGYTKPDETFLNLMTSPELAKKFQYVRNVLDLTGKTGSEVMGHWLNLLYLLPKEVHKALSEGRNIELRVVDGTDKRQELQH